MHVGLRGRELPSWQAGLSVEDVDDGPFGTMELETFCDTESGQSGGPLFAYWDEKQYICRSAVGLPRGIYLFLSTLVRHRIPFSPGAPV